MTVDYKNLGYSDEMVEILTLNKKLQNNINYKENQLTTVSKDGKNILILACELGLEEVAMHIYNRKGYKYLIFQTDKDGNDVFRYLCKHNMKKMFDMIFTHQDGNSVDILNYIDIDKVNNNNETLMIMLCKEKIGTLGLTLLKNKFNYDLKFNLEHQNNEKMTALMYAIQNNLTKIAIVIIKKMKNINQVDINGNTSLILAIKHKNITIIEELLKIKNININWENNSGKTALMYAGMSDNIEMVRLLINCKNCNVSKKNVCCDDVMTQSIINLNEELLLEIVKKWDDFNYVYPNGNTLLMDALCLHLSKISEFIITSKKYNFDFVDKTNKTTLIYAIEKKFTKGALLILNSNENIKCDHEDNMKNTALYYSTKNNLMEVTEKLLKRKDCNLESENIYGQDFLGNLMTHKQEDCIVKLLKNHGNKFKHKFEEIFCASLYLNLIEVQKTLKEKINFKKVNNFLQEFENNK
jgi:ankyrin repeat protein